MNLKDKIERLIDTVIQEDLGKGDITTNACIPADAPARGTITLKQSAVVAGLPFLERIFQKINPKIQIVLKVEEGSQHKAGTVIAELSGPVSGILASERVVLNFLQYVSGIATVTAGYVRKMNGYDCTLLATRATVPALRPLAKYGVEIGGGTMHRYSLDERVIIKRNHLAFLAANSSHPMTEAVQRVRQSHPKVDIELEVRHYRELAEALKLDVESIMLDNMTPDDIKKCVKEIHAAKKKAWAQSTVEITPDTIRDYARTGVDGICIGAVTHSVPNIQISLKLTA